MNIIFFTQSRSLDVFYQVFLRIKKKLNVDRVGFYVSNKKHYKKFLIEHPNFEKQFTILKEWKIYLEVEGHIPNFNRISKYEQEIGNPTLWTPIVTDRRLYFGEKITYRQDYKPFFTYEQQLSIIDIALKGIDNFISDINPDLICTIYTATFGDCLGHQFAEARGIRSLDLRLSRLKNYVMFVDGVKEPPPHIEYILKKNDEALLEEKKKEAEDYVNEVLKKNAMYEGVVPARIKNEKDKSSGQSYGTLSKGIRFISNNFNTAYRYDPQNPDLLQSYIYKKFINPYSLKRIKNALKDFLADGAFIEKNRYVLYLLHTEPELVLSQFARPYLNQIEVIRNISLSVPVGKTVLVKEHPMMLGRRTMNFYKNILQIPNVMLVDFDLSSKSVLSNAELVVTIRGAIGLEAVISKIPVVSLGRSMFELLPVNMFRFCESLYNLPNEIKDSIENYEYDHDALIKYLAAVIAGSTPVNLVTDLLGKKGRYKEDVKEYDFKYHPHLDVLADYFIKRIHQAQY